ncbi:ABC transporter ATP-binding protein [Enorma sp.]|uniref:ABC transporter ATP-binding protein n=1 Tax=Enorma sp. TaxID=1920692 RepID=UPI003AB48D75
MPSPDRTPSFDRMPSLAIDFEGVNFAYPGAAEEAVRGVTLRIPRGERVCILGGNGSGKSTLARLMNALLVPTGGQARTLGLDIDGDPEQALEIRRRAAMVFQYPDDQMVTSIVADDVAFGPENLGVPSDEIARRVDSALEAVGMTEFAQADPADLSGGQRQRVAIAGALAMNPEVLILDEPAAMLDAHGRQAIQRVLRGLSERGITIVHITHFMDDALDADRVIVLERGAVALDGSPDEVFSQRDAIRALGLELPFELRLEDAVAGARKPDEQSLPNPGRKRHVFSQSDPITVHILPEFPEHREQQPTKERAAITFEHVSFSYADTEHPHRRTGLLARLGVHPRRRMPRAADTLRGVSFTVPTGSLTALIGSTGSGKSTTAELACALKLPNTGTVRIEGIDSADGTRRDDLRARVGYVAQLPERQLFAETVFDDIAFGPRNLGLSAEEVERRVSGALDAVGLSHEPDLLERSPFALSGGQRRAVAIAGVLAMQPAVLVLDEPMAGLDPQARRRMRALMLALKEAGTTLFVITHDMDDVAELADHVVALNHGVVVAEGTPRTVFDIDEALLPGVPSALAAARRLRAQGVPIEGDPLTIDELAQEVRHVSTR